MRPTPSTGNPAQASTEDDLLASAAHHLLHHSVRHGLRVDDGLSSLVDLVAVRSDQGRRCPGRVYASELDFWGAALPTAELGGEAFVEDEGGGFGHAVVHHASVW